MTTKNKNAQVAATNIENIENENKEVVNMEQVQEATEATEAIEATEATKVTETTEATEAAPSASLISKAAGFKAVDAEGNELGIVTMQELQDTIASQVLEVVSQRMQANTLEEPAMLAATASAKAASDAFENKLTEASDFQWVRTLASDGNSTRVNKDNFAQVVGELSSYGMYILTSETFAGVSMLFQKSYSAIDFNILLGPNNVNRNYFKIEQKKDGNTVTITNLSSSSSCMFSINKI